MPTEFISFTGTVPENYDRYLGPFLFEPCARHLVKTIETDAIQSVLEIACGTGRVTRHLRQLFPTSVIITATDLNTAMLQIAKTNLDDDSIIFKQADAEELPFSDNSFDLVVCQYGIMFVPDKQKAFREMFRVLKKNGTLIFNTWDKLENNRPAFIVSNVISEYFNHDIPNFYKLPHGTYNTKEIDTMLEACSFRDISVEGISLWSESPSAKDIATGFITGTPAFHEIQTRDASAPQKIIDLAAAKIEEELGNNPVRSLLNAFLFHAKK